MTYRVRGFVKNKKRKKHSLFEVDVLIYDTTHTK